MNLRVPKELLASCEAVAERWVDPRSGPGASGGDTRHGGGVTIPLEEPAIPAERGVVVPLSVKCRETMPALHHSQHLAGQYPSTVSHTALAVLELHGCKYAFGEPGDADFAFCNREKTHGSYCAEHHALLYRPVKR